MKKLICILTAMLLLTGCTPPLYPRPKARKTPPPAVEETEEQQALSVAGTYTYEEHLELGGQTIDST